MTTGTWQIPPANPAPDRDEVHVWRVKVPPEPTLVDVNAMPLSADERARAGRFYFEEDRTRFVLAHGALRRILGRHLAVPPGEIAFRPGPQGKPSLVPLPGQTKLTFNLSHSGGYVLIAVGNEREVGVDVERIRPEIDLLGIARRFFSEAEQAALLDLAADQRPAGFFRCWTRKEAYIKARGGGLSIPLGQFDVTLDPGAAALLATRDDPEEAGRWSLYNLEVGDDAYQAALAVEGTGVRIRLWDWVGG